MALPADHKLEMYRGDTFYQVFRLRAEVDGVPGDYYDLTGCVPTAQIRRGPRATGVALAEFTCAILPQLGDTLGGVSILLEPADTATLPTIAFWDLQLVHPDTTVRTFLAGEVETSGQVTQ